MYLIEFAQDVLRFAKHGLLLRFCWLLVARMEVLLCACIIAAMFEYASSPPTQFMVGNPSNWFRGSAVRDVHGPIPVATVFRLVRRRTPGSKGKTTIRQRGDRL